MRCVGWSRVYVLKYVLSAIVLRVFCFCLFYVHNMMILVKPLLSILFVTTWWSLVTGCFYHSVRPLLSILFVTTWWSLVTVCFYHSVRPLLLAVNGPSHPVIDISLSWGTHTVVCIMLVSAQYVWKINSYTHSVKQLSLLFCHRFYRWHWHDQVSASAFI